MDHDATSKGGIRAATNSRSSGTDVSVGRQRFAELIGYPPAQHLQHEAAFDYAAIDTVIPHPVYATQGWVSILNPGEHTDAQVRIVLAEAHTRAVRRHRPLT